MDNTWSKWDSKFHIFKRGQIVKTTFGRAKVVKIIGPRWEDDIEVRYGNGKRTRIVAEDLDMDEDDFRREDALVKRLASQFRLMGEGDPYNEG